MRAAASPSSSSSSWRSFAFTVILAVALRLLLLFFGAGDIASRSYEVTTPVTSYNRVLEGLYYVDQGLSPYAGSAFHQPPLVLALVDILRSSSDALVPLLFIFLDVVVACYLFRIGSLYERTILPEDIRQGAILDKDKDQVLNNLPLIMSAVYLFNPWSMLSCVAHSTVVFETLTIVAGFYSALASNVVLAAFFTALSSYFSLYSVTLILPFLVLLRRMASINNTKSTLKAFLILPLFAVFASALLFISYLYLGSWEFLEKAYLYTFMVEDLQPNIGLFWYYLAEMFPNFRVFFVFVFQYNVFIYVAPLLYWLRFPIFLWLHIGIIATFKAYPSVGDVAFFLSFIPLFYHKIQRFQWGFAMAGAYIYLSFLYPIIWRIWIFYASGNSNFYYALNLVTAFVNSTIMSEALAAVLKRRFLIKRRREEIEEAKKSK